MNNASTTPDSPDAALARGLANMWPHRLHESNVLKSLFCGVRLHRWAKLDLEGLIPAAKQVRFCRWCSNVKINGIVYKP